MADDYEKIKDEISKIKEQFEGLKESVDAIAEKIESQGNAIAEKIESQGNADPYANLSIITQEAMNQVKRELADALQEGVPEKIEKVREKQKDIEKTLTKIEGIVEQVKGEEENSIQYENPLYPKKRIDRLFPWLYSRKSHQRSSRNWLGLLLAGIGLGLIFRGIGEASEALQSIQGSIILGAIILGLLAWLEKRKVFSLLGGD